MEITVIKEENRGNFAPLMPEELWREADLEIGAIWEETACGVLALTEKGTVFTVTYLYVAEEFRRKGVASELLKSLHALARRTGKDVTMVPLSSGEETRELELCLEKNLFEKDDVSNPIYVTTLGDVSEKLMKGKAGANAQAVPLAESSSHMWNNLLRALEKLPDENGTVPELDVKARYDQEASFLLVRGTDTAGCILFDRREGDYILSYFCALKDVTPKEMMSLFSASYEVLRRRCGDDTEIYINTLTKTTEKMVLAMTDHRAKKAGQAVTWYCLY